MSDNLSKPNEEDGRASDIQCTGDEPLGDNDLTEPCGEFDDMGLCDDLLRGIYGHGFEKPSMIQQKAIRPLAFSKRDLIAQAQAARQDGDLRHRPAPEHRLVLAHVPGDHPLADARAGKQSATVADALGRYTGASVLACVGGGSMREQANALRRGAAQLVVGTPGRVLDLLERGILDTTNVRCVVLDEADEMLDAGFKDQIQDVIKKVPREAKIALFSATLPPESLELAAQWMPDALRIVVKKEELTLAGIKSFYVFCGEDDRHKFMALSDLYNNLSITQAVIFVNSRRKADWLSKELNDQDFTVSTIHSELTQEERADVMAAFRAGSARVLVATDVLARGIDVQQVNLVINYDLPRDLASYIHRVGRSGRFGRKGVAINLLAGNGDVRSLREIEQYYAADIQELPSDLSALD